MCCSFSTIILWNMMHVYIISFIVSICLAHVDPHTIMNLDQSTPKAHSTSFLIDSCRWMNNFLLSPSDIGIILTNLAHSRYISSARQHPIFWWISFTIYYTIEACPYKISLNKLDWLKTLMLSYATTTKENACQIHKSCVATASSIIIGLQ